VHRHDLYSVVFVSGVATFSGLSFSSPALYILHAKLVGIEVGTGGSIYPEAPTTVSPIIRVSAG
jgi:hypothetical protein